MNPARATRWSVEIGTTLSVSSDGRVIISIGDVSGSGLNAAVTMANMRQVIRATGYVSPDPLSILGAVDKVLRTEYPQTTVTAFVGIIDPVERILTYASAGHPPPLLHHRDGTIDELPYRGVILGFRGRDEPPVSTIPTPDGSWLILYTDGLLESTRDYEEGERRLRAALTNQGVYASPNVAKALYDAILYDGVRDDVAILVVGFPPPEAGAERRFARWTFESSDVQAARNAQSAFTERLRSERFDAADVVTAWSSSSSSCSAMRLGTPPAGSRSGWIGAHPPRCSMLSITARALRTARSCPRIFSVSPGAVSTSSRSSPKSSASRRFRDKEATPAPSS